MADNSTVVAGNVPVLETKHLLLREYRIEDLPAFVAMWSEADFFRYLGGQPLSEEEVWGRILRQVGHWQLMGYGYWAVEEKATGEFVGTVGFSDFKRVLEPSIKGVPEIGWVLAPRVHGKGYATQAAKAAVAWGDVQFQQARTVCIIHPENYASLHVAHKCGYREYQRTTYKCEPIVLLER